MPPFYHKARMSSPSTHGPPGEVWAWGCGPGPLGASPHVWGPCLLSVWAGIFWSIPSLVWTPLFGPRRCLSEHSPRPSHSLCAADPQISPGLMIQTETCTTQHAVVLVVMIYYGGRKQNTITKAERHVGWSLRKPGSSLHESFPSGVPQNMLNSCNELWQHMWNAIYLGTSLDTHCPRVLLGAGHRALQRTCQNSRLLEWQQVFSIKHIVQRV